MEEKGNVKQTFKTKTTTIMAAVKNNWLTILLAVISAGWFAETIGLFKFNQELNQSDKTLLINELRDDRNYYQTLYRDCQESVNDMQKDLAFLKSNLQLVGAITNDLPMPMWLKDVDGRMMYLNKAYEQAYLIPMGLTANDYIGKTDADVWGEEIGEMYRQADAIAMQSDKPTISIERVEGKGLKSRDIKVVKYRRKLGNTVLGIGGMAIEQ